MNFILFFHSNVSSTLFLVIQIYILGLIKKINLFYLSFKKLRNYYGNQYYSLLVLYIGITIWFRIKTMREDS